MIPIVFIAGLDPIEIGLVATLARPGGKVTGPTSMAAELGPKRLELQRELIPTASVIAALVNTYNPNAEARLIADNADLKLRRQDRP